jgi:sarcosine oxidase subunit alpha
MDKMMDDDAFLPTARSRAPLKVRGGFRLAAGGAIDRSVFLRFTFDGKAFLGHPGDTLASALLANGVRRIARSARRGRPRGIFATGLDDCALVTLRGEGRQAVMPAAMVELFDGLDAAGHDGEAGRLHDVGNPALWREAAFEDGQAVHVDCDVLVIGSGLAGLSAARAAAGAGARVIVLEQDGEAGGGALADPALFLWRAEMLQALAERPSLRILTRATAVGAYGEGLFAAVERVGEPASATSPLRLRLHLIQARKAILASGAAERLIALPNNDRPGVMLATAARSYVNRFGAAPGRRAVFFVNNDEAYAAVRDLAVAGIAIAAIVDPREPTPIAAEASAAGHKALHGHEVAGVTGRRCVDGVLVRRVGEQAASALACDLLCLSGGYTPRVELAAQAGLETPWNDGIAGFVAPDGDGDLAAAGAAAGRFGRLEAAEHGARLGAAAAASLGFAHAPAPHHPPVAAKRDGPVLPIWEVKNEGKAFVDLRRDETADDVRRAAGRGRVWTGGLVGSAVLAEALDLPIAATRFRPPTDDRKRSRRP